MIPTTLTQTIQNNILQQHNANIFIGVDEVGRGCLAGPVVACALYLPNHIMQQSWVSDIADSKTISATKRKYLYNKLTNHSLYAIAMVNSATIDKINILQSALLAMYNACSLLLKQHTQLQNNYICTIDGNKDFNYLKPQYQLHSKINSCCLIKGDQKSISIAAASVVAKHTRDTLMQNLNNLYIYKPYGFAKHVGYGTKQHLQAINKYGLTCYHRLSFKPISTQLLKT